MSSGDNLKPTPWRAATGRASRAGVPYTPKLEETEEKAQEPTRSSPRGLPISLEEFRRIREKTRNEASEGNTQVDPATIREQE